MKCWCALYTRPHRERHVSSLPEGKRPETCLATVRAKKDSHRKTEPFFCCYLFARFDPAHALSETCWTAGLRRIVSFGGQPTTVPHELISSNRKRLAESGESGRRRGEGDTDRRVPVLITTSPLGWESGLRATGSVMAGIAASNATGLVREMVIASYFGATSLTAVYLLALTIPEVLFTLLGEVINATLVPLLTRYYTRAEKGPLVPGCWPGHGSGSDSGPGYRHSTAPLYVPLLAPGFDAPEVHLTAALARLMFPAVIFWGLSASTSALSNTYRRFSPATAVYNSTFIVVALRL